ncbi:MAG: hypothetical protein CMH54_14435 [Myxococcales bacterium]|nr:hypothetical protein [Myxococcales bacterium]
MKRFLLLILVATGFLYTGCGGTIIVSENYEYEEYEDVEVPSQPTSVRPARPAGDHVWVKGHYEWKPRVGKYVWVRGHWEPIRPAKTWVPGHYEWKRRGRKRVKVWVRGSWK